MEQAEKIGKGYQSERIFQLAAGPGSFHEERSEKEENLSCSLFFSSNRRGGKGGFDIWYSVANEKGEFGKAINCGTKINTSGDEITPLYSEDTKTLYFSSDYHPNAGGFDVFKSKGNQNKFNKVQNIGFPVNSSFEKFALGALPHFHNARLLQNQNGWKQKAGYRDPV